MRHTTRLIPPRRLAYITAGAFLCAGAVAVAHAGFPDTPDYPAKARHIDVDATSSATSPSAAPDSTASITVNGQPIDVPANGNAQQTVTDDSGQTTTVNISTSQQSSAQNSSSSSFSLNVHSSTSDNSGASDE